MNTKKLFLVGLLVLIWLFPFKVFGEDLANARLDDLQTEYLSRLKKNFDKIKEAYKEQLLLYKKPYENPEKASQNKKRDEQLTQIIKECSKEMDDLKIDALKYYKGKLPIELSEQWKSIEIEHALLMYQQGTELNKIYEETMKRIK